MTRLSQGGRVVVAGRTISLGINRSGDTTNLMGFVPAAVLMQEHLAWGKKRGHACMHACMHV
jgi:hypothetical protein